MSAPQRSQTVGGSLAGGGADVLSGVIGRAGFGSDSAMRANYGMD
jgi:hypothetical protein